MEKQCKKVSLLGMGILLWAINLLALFPCETGFAQGPDTLWTRTYGGDTTEYGYSVQQTSDGGYIVAGFTESFGAGDYDVYLIKTDTSGDALWTKTYGGTERDWSRSVQQTSDGGYIIAGRTESFGAGYADIYLIKANANGKTLWTKTYGGTYYDMGSSVQQTSDGGYIVTGGTESFGAGGWDVYLIKTDVSGDTLWTRTYGGTYDDFGHSVQQTSDGGYIIAGFTESFGAGYQDVYLIKTDTKGDTLWTKTYGGIGYDWSSSAQQTSDGGYIVAGYTFSFGAGLGDVYLIKTDVKGNSLWAKTYGGKKADIGWSVQETSNGGYIIVGETESFGAGGGDVYLIKTDVSGDTLWTRTYGGDSSDVGRSVQQTSDGGYIIAGETYSFGAGASDVYLIKTKPEKIGIKGSFQEAFSIFECEPNPSTNITLIKYGLLKNSNVSIVIYDLLGQEIKTLVNKKENAGIHTIVWNGRDDGGEKVSSGVYFLRFEAARYNATRKLLIMR